MPALMREDADDCGHGSDGEQRDRSMFGRYTETLPIPMSPDPADARSGPRAEAVARNRGWRRRAGGPSRTTRFRWL